MNMKKLFITTIVLFVVLEILSYLVHVVIFGSTYEAEGIKEAFRSMEEMSSKMWVMYVTDFIWTFFFSFFFAKGYENKGIMEGVRYGFYIGIFFSLIYSYQNYVVFPIPYSLAFQWFVSGLVISIILGIIAALLYKPAAATSSSAGAASQ